MPGKKHPVVTFEEVISCKQRSRLHPHACRYLVGSDLGRIAAQFHSFTLGASHHLITGTLSLQLVGLVCLLPLTPATRDVLNARTFALLPTEARAHGKDN